MVSPYMVYRNLQHLLHINCHFFFCIATVSLLQPSSFFQVIPLNGYTPTQNITELYPILIHYRTITYLTTLPNYTLS